MRYFIKITQDHITPKNNLQKEIKLMAKTQERYLLMNNSKRMEWINDFIDKVEELNKKHNRCKAEKVWVHTESEYYENGEIEKYDVSIYITGLVVLCAYAVRDDEFKPKT